MAGNKGITIANGSIAPELFGNKILDNPISLITGRSSE
jgi:hypothetical protein